MVEGIDGSKVPYLRLEGKMPLSSASKWILGAILEITELVELEDLIEKDFHCLVEIVCSLLRLSYGSH